MNPTPSAVPASITSAVRWLATALFAMLATKGYVTQDQAATITPALLMLVPLCFGIWQKIATAKHLNQVAVTPSVTAKVPL